MEAVKITSFQKSFWLQGQDLFVTVRNTMPNCFSGKGCEGFHQWATWIIRTCLKIKDKKDSSYYNLSVFIFGLLNDAASRSLSENNKLKGYLRNYTSFHLQRLRKTTKKLSYITDCLSDKILKQYPFPQIWSTIHPLDCDIISHIAIDNHRP